MAIHFVFSVSVCLMAHQLSCLYNSWVGKTELLLSQRYLSESERHSLTGVRTRLLCCFAVQYVRLYATSTQSVLFSLFCFVFLIKWHTNSSEEFIEKNMHYTQKMHYTQIYIIHKKCIIHKYAFSTTKKSNEIWFEYK